ncbi:MAG: lipid II flippase MurJ [Candidatus Peribacteraceae bacterium]|nr:lipid II flippase MurJ [Candidatus Peribacteraceae bacterium]MDD5742711.1 lipid II flippase MurJ [Candidatus Peribacteraceae bacterium]
MRFHALRFQHRILGGAAVLAVTQFGASVAGLIRDRLLAQTFPGLSTVDVYIASFRPSDLLFQIFIMAGFSVALVPLLARYHVDRDEREMERLLNGVICISSVGFGLIALMLTALMPWIAPHLTQFTGGDLALYIRFARLALLINFLFVFANAYGQYLLTVQRFWVYGLAPILYTLGTIAGTLWLTPVYGQAGPMLGTVIGAVVCMFARLAALLWRGYRPRFMLWHPDIGQLGLLMIPRMIALAMLYVELLIFDGIASGMPAGSVTVNAYTRNFQSVIIGVSGIALALSIFSLLSQSAAKGEWHRYGVYLRKGILYLLALTIPGAIALVLLTPVAVWLVHLERQAALFSICLTLYAFSIPFESLNHLFSRAYFALKDTTRPAIFNVVNAVVAVAVAWWFAPAIGVFSLPLGYTLGHVVQMAGLALLLPHKPVTAS